MANTRRKRIIETSWEYVRVPDADELLAEALWVILNDPPTRAGIDTSASSELNERASVEGNNSTKQLNDGRE
jgi:hypothetical protein